MRAILLFGLIPVAACQPAPPVTADTGKTDIYATAPQTAEACSAIRGTWKRAGLAGIWQCIFPLPDGGKKCSDASDCLGQCIASSPTPQLIKAVGRCQRDSDGFGCYSTVDQGRVSPEICHD